MSTPTEETTAAPKTGKARKGKGSGMNWDELYDRGESAPKAELAAEENPPSPSVRRTPQTQRARPVRKPMTYRMSLDALALVEAEIVAEAEKGNKLTAGDAVIAAVRALYAPKHSGETVAEIVERMQAEIHEAEERKKG